MFLNGRPVYHVSSHHLSQIHLGETFLPMTLTGIHGPFVESVRRMVRGSLDFKTLKSGLDRSSSSQHIANIIFKSFFNSTPFVDGRNGSVPGCLFATRSSNSIFERGSSI